MPAPARCTTASAPSTTPGSRCPLEGSHWVSSSARGVRRTRRRTSCPSARRLATSAEPISPDEPVMTTFTAVLRGRAAGGSEPWLRLELALFQSLLDRREEARRVGTIDHPVVVGQREIEHVPHRVHPHTPRA